MAFTSKDVARLAGVSQSTVSYVLNGNRPISEDTRRRVRAAIEELTYQPNAGARALASQRTRVIGLVAPFGSGDTTGLHFIETITATARQHDHDVLLVTADEGAAGLVRLAQRSLVDAIVLMEIGEQDPRVEVAAGLGIPVVLVGVPEDTRGLPCVDLDFEQAATMAVDDLARQHTDRLVMLGHPAELAATGINYIRRFYRSAEQAAARHDLPLQIVVPPGSTRSAVSGSLLPALAGSGRTGLLLPHFAAVPAALSALAWAEIAVPDQVAVIALCTDSTAEATDPPVSNVSLEPRDVSRRAMAILFAQLDGTPRPQQTATQQTVAHTTVPHETVPHETVPHETVPRDGAGQRHSTPDIELVTPRLTHRGTTHP